MNTYFQSTRFEWNLLIDGIKNATSLAMFKSKVVSTIRPLKRTMYGIRDIIGISVLRNFVSNLVRSMNTDSVINLNASGHCACVTWVTKITHIRTSALPSLSQDVS